MEGDKISGYAMNSWNLIIPGCLSIIEPVRYVSKEFVTLT